MRRRCDLADVVCRLRKSRSSPERNKLNGLGKVWMGQIILQDVGISFSENLFKNISFSFGIGDRVGVVGNNGAGKTALLRCIAGLAEPAEGTIIRPKRSRLGYVEQVIPQALTALSLREAIFDGI